jgi:cyclophilin family peptidyl-prolyl cis-trans isomerase
MEEARVAQAKARRRGITFRFVTAVVALLVAAGAIYFLATRDVGDPEETDGSTTTEGSTLPEDPSDTEPTAAPITLPAGPEGRTIDGPTECPATDGSEERVAQFSEAPPMCIEEGEELVADIAVTTTDAAGETTEAGTITVALDSAAAPKTVNNFVVLSRYGFYDGIPFHRLVPQFVAQVGGAGTPGPDGAPDYGTTGPGYDAEDVEHPTDGYAVGDLAMARSSTVSGSQFFIVTDEAGVPGLDQNGTYPRFGRVTEGLDLAVEMANSGDPDGAPTQLYTIDSVTIRPATD